MNPFKAAGIDEVSGWSKKDALNRVPINVLWFGKFDSFFNFQDANFHFSIFDTLKLQVINRSYSKKLHEGLDFYETDPPVSTMRYRLNPLLFFDINLHVYALHG